MAFDMERLPDSRSHCKKKAIGYRYICFPFKLPGLTQKYCFLTEQSLVFTREQTMLDGNNMAFNT